MLSPMAALRRFGQSLTVALILSAPPASSSSAFARGSSRSTNAQSEVRRIRNAIAMYADECGGFPNPTAGNFSDSPGIPVATLVRWAPGSMLVARERTLPDALIDPWGNPYHYLLSLSSGSFIVWSSGPNGRDQFSRGDDIGESWLSGSDSNGTGAVSRSGVLPSTFLGLATWLFALGVAFFLGRCSRNSRPGPDA